MLQRLRKPFDYIGNRTVFLFLIGFAVGTLWQSLYVTGMEFDWNNNIPDDFWLSAQSLGTALITIDEDGWSSGFWQNFSTEMFGAVITFILFNQILGAQQERKQQQFFQ